MPAGLSAMLRPALLYDTVGSSVTRVIAIGLVPLGGRDFMEYLFVAKLPSCMDPEIGLPLQCGGP